MAASVRWKSGPSILDPGGHVVITGDLNSAFQSQASSSSTVPTAMTISTMNLDGGQFIIGRDSLEPITIPGDLTLSHNGLLSIGRDQTGTLAVGGSIVIDSGGQISVGRNQHVDRRPCTGGRQHPR